MLFRPAILAARRMIPALALGMALATNLALSPLGHAAEEGPRLISLNGPAGIYPLGQWKKDWPGCTFEGGIRDGRVSLTDANNQRWLRVSFIPGQIGPEKGGAGWRFPFGTHEFAELTYTLRFSPDFDWVKGGKLPGLCGGPDHVSGGRPANGKNGFSARLMWRKDGRGQAYVYHKHQPTNYGDQFNFPDDFRFPTDSPVQVKIQVGMNTAGQRNGTLRVWITTAAAPARLMVDRADLQWRDDASFGVDSLYFETFHGGSDETWAPTRPCWAEFGGFKLGFIPASSDSQK
ncbi:polysaccharide lyase [Verrucomicrobium sp. BvORR106]|uniref:polysaccharide lyase n=1 Tax=Verrucomicrobium sp. BvORR106 TaxID=1403819 RepID=UPI002240FCE8|nr:hypothetical protein [Verrucomicrobium sp. BvORR106]